MLTIVPMTVGAARRRVKLWHRHLPDLQGGLFAAGVAVDADVVGVAVAGVPARVWDGSGRILISRVATAEVKNACSMLYGALCRAAKALGWIEAWTYTRLDEPGTSLRAAGFEDMGLTNGRESKRRPMVMGGAKRRWRRML